MRKSRWVIIIAVLISVGIAIVYGFLPKPVPVDMAKAWRGTMRVTIEEEGKTRVRDRFVVSSPISGFMRRIRLDVGDPVKKGSTVVELEPLRSEVLDPRSRAAAEATVSAAEATLRAAEENARAKAADAEYTKANLERIRKLFNAGFMPKDSLEKAESEARRTEANRMSAEADVKAALFELDKARTALRSFPVEGTASHAKIVGVHSPVGGRVLRIHRKSEGIVHPGTPLIDVGDPRKLEVTAEVLSADAIKIKPGTPVLFDRWGGKPALEGKVRVVEPAGFTKISSLGVEEQRVLVIADITSLPDLWLRLGDDYRVETHFIVWEGKDVLQIPVSALFRKGEGWAVFVVKDKRAHERQVQIGHRTGLTAEILSGLEEETMVIIHPDDTIREGTRVRPR
jgi:HlyD family secretion protein